MGAAERIACIVAGLALLVRGLRGRPRSIKRRSVTIHRSRDEVELYCRSEDRLKDFVFALEDLEIVPAPGSQGTEVHAHLEQASREGERRLWADLRRLKKRMEAGELVAEGDQLKEAA